jgi:hypothetical protein
MIFQQKTKTPWSGKLTLPGTSGTQSDILTPSEPLIPPVKESKETTPQTAAQTAQQTATQSTGEKPLQFLANDGTVQTGYYGTDETGKSGYYADAGRTEKLDNGNWSDPGALTYGGYYTTDGRYIKTRGKIADTSQHPELAGQTVYQDGRILSYDKLGYLAQELNADNDRNAGVLRGRSMDAINGDPRRNELSGTDMDLYYLTTYELGRISEARKAAERGEISWDEANRFANSIRAKYGYTGNADGSAFTSTGSGKLPTLDGVGSSGDRLYTDINTGETALIPGTATGAATGTIGGTIGGYPQSATRGTDSLAAELRALYTGDDSPYARALAAYQAAQDAAAEQAVNRLEGQRSDTDSKYAALYRQLYRDSMNARQNLDQRLAAQGLTGGAAESTRLGYATSYADALRQGEESRIGELGAIDRAISDARLSGAQQSAQLAAELERDRTNQYADVLRALLSRGDSLEQQDWERNYQLYRDAQNDARYAQQWARQLENDAYDRQTAADQQAYSRQLTADQQAYDREQDAYSRALALAQLAAKIGDYSGYTNLGIDTSALTETGEPEYSPTFSMAQLITERDYLSKHPEATPSPTFLRDYEYYYGAPYGGGSTQSGTVQSGGTSYNNGGLTREQVKTVQSAWNAAHPEAQIAVDGFWGPNSQRVTQFLDAASALATLSTISEGARKR